MRRNLVIVRAGDSSLHQRWLQGAAERNWDLIVSYFGDDPDRFRADGIGRIDAKGPKWPALALLLRDLAPLLDGYDYIWLPDDDLDADAPTVNDLFDLCAHYNLTLAQPALSEDSYVGHPITEVDRRKLLRYTNFVEIMAPCFRRDFLLRCLPDFDANLSGWGLDYIWPTMVEGRDELAIIDATVVRHTRPLGGPNYNAIRAAGVLPHEEFSQLLRRKGVSVFPKTVHGHIDADESAPGAGRRFRQSLAVCTTVRTPRPDFGVWLDYHTRKAELVLVFLRDPAHRAAVEQLAAGKEVLVLDGSTPLANHGWAIIHALRQDITWLLPLDDDELLFDGGDRRWQNIPDAGRVRFTDHEALPAPADAVNRFAVCTVFNVNGRRGFLGPAKPGCAVRVTPGVRPSGARSFAGFAGRDCEVVGPAILRYPVAPSNGAADSLDAETTSRLLQAGDLRRFEPMTELLNRPVANPISSPRPAHIDPPRHEFSSRTESNQAARRTPWLVR